MIIPIRCFTCGKVIAHLLETYLEELQKNITDEEKLSGIKNNYDSDKTIEGKILDDLKLDRICCRSHFLCYNDFSRNISV
jgi:DNA-directed RNA polymerase subunit N (RpoN/RPB10)|tara:strand:+ start:17 stop:256 length:240 start_codon:yes stop_codon:yes gene_type:complete